MSSLLDSRILRIGAVLSAAVTLGSAAHAEIAYSVKPLPEQNKLQITIRFAAKAGPVEMQIPNWGPGSYRLSFPWKSIQEFAMTGSDGAALNFEKPNDFTWKASLASDATVTASYTVPNTMTGGVMHYSGPATYMYLPNRKTEACKLSLDVPAGWKTAIGLDESKSQKNVFVAPTYDVLADNPVTMGDFIEMTYTSFGKPHIIAMRGAAAAQVDKEALIKLCKFVTDSEGDFFGGSVPYSKYVWHFSVTGQRGGGGLEHLSSTQISFGQAMGPGTDRLFAHEFFHLWNVKRIRSKVLGPFDYTQLPKTGALWWLEGTTDYYASLIPLRYGLYQPETFYNDLANNVRAVRSNAARLEVSPHDASYRVGEAANGIGNSNGFNISYYNLGWLLGLCLDIELRSRTNGRRSLDDVERALWDLCKNDKPGFEEDEIRKQLIRFGGSEMGAVYDKWVMSPGELPIEDQIAKAGLKIDTTPETYVDLGFVVGAFGGGQGNGGANATPPPGARISQVRDVSSPLSNGDLLLEVNGKSVLGATPQETNAKARDAVNALKADLASKLKIQRGDQTMEVSITPKSATRPAFKIVSISNATKEQISLRDGWFYAGKRKTTTK